MYFFNNQLAMFISLIFAIAFFSPNINNAQVISQAESAEYDASQNRWFISNSNILTRAADGTLEIFGNASGSYGLEVMNGVLYAVHNGNVKGYDLNTAQEVMSASLIESAFLNGLASDGVDKLYVTDFGLGTIYQIDVSDLNNPQVEMIVDDTETTPNGIIFDGANNRLLYTSWQGSNAPIKAVDLSDYSVSDVITTNVGRIDGIDDDAAGNYYISSWSPARITKYDNTFSNPEIITTPFINNPADIGYSMETDTLAIPIGDDVVFVGFGMTSPIEEVQEDLFGLTVYPNPVQQQSIIQFSLPTSMELELSLLSMDGKLLSQLLSGHQPAGSHTISMQGHEFAAGQYLLLMKTKSQHSTVRLLFVD